MALPGASQKNTQGVPLPIQRLWARRARRASKRPNVASLMTHRKLGELYGGYNQSIP